MGRSYTYHILGEGTPDATGAAQVYPCMNKREMAQAVYRADLIGLPIVAWTAQTGTGARWIGMPGPWVSAKVDAVKLPKLVDCPVCAGHPGHNESGIAYYCPVCNSTGKTTRGYERGWTDWQLAEMRKRNGVETAA